MIGEMFFDSDEALPVIAVIVAANRTQTVEMLMIGKGIHYCCC